MLTGVILAGGDHSRTGGANKALLPLGGKLMIHRQIEEMSTLCKEIMVVTNKPRDFLGILNPETRLITDFRKGFGLFSGLHAALSLARTEYLWVVGCDQPYISSAVASRLHTIALKGKADAVLPALDGHPQYLHGIYNKACRETLEENMDAQTANLLSGKRLKVRHVSEEEFERYGLPIHIHHSFKTPEQYVELAK